MSWQLDRKLRQAVIDKLADETTGFNATMASIAPTAEVDPFEINFDLQTTANFFLGTFALENLTDEMLSRLPLMAVSSQQAINLRLRKAFTFSGEASAGIQTIIDWPGENQDFETLIDVVEESFLKIFNVPDEPTQAWGDGIVYDGQISFTRSGLIGSSVSRWVRILDTAMQFHVDVK